MFCKKQHISARNCSLKPPSSSLWLYAIFLLHRYKLLLDEKQNQEWLLGHLENLEVLISLQQSLNRSYSIRRNSKGFDTLNGHGAGLSAQLGLRRTQCACLVPTQPSKQEAYGFLVVLSPPACSLKMEISFPEPPLFKEIEPDTGWSLLSAWDLGFTHLTTLLFLWHSAGFSFRVPVYCAPDSAASSASQSSIPGFVTMAGKLLLSNCTQERAELSLSL